MQAPPTNSSKALDGAPRSTLLGTRTDTLTHPKLLDDGIPKSWVSSFLKSLSHHPMPVQDRLSPWPLRVAAFFDLRPSLLPSTILMNANAAAREIGDQDVAARRVHDEVAGIGTAARLGVEVGQSA